MVYIRLKKIVEESFQDYKKPAMLLATCFCNWKCLKEQNLDISICQNSDLHKQKDIIVDINRIISSYIDNPITKSIVIAGLEPFLQFDEIFAFINGFRKICEDDIVIYTGYYPNEIKDKILKLQQYKNIVIKFGRYKPNDKKIFDDVLGVWLISSNQFAQQIS